MSGLRATIRAPGVEFRFQRPRRPAGAEVDLLDLGSCIRAAGRLAVRVQAPVRGRREAGRLTLPLAPDPAAAALPDRGELRLELGLAFEDGAPVLLHLELRVEPVPARLVVGEGAGGLAWLGELAATPIRTIRMEAVDAERARLTIASDEEPEVELVVSRALSDLVGAGDAGWWRTLLASLLAVLDGGTIEVDAGALGSLSLVLESSSGEAVTETRQSGVVALPALSADLRLAAGRYRLGARELPDALGPIHVEAKLAPSTVPLGERPARAAGRLDVTALELAGLLGFAGGEARVELQGRGRIQISRTGGTSTLRFSGAVLRSEGLRIGVEGEPGRDLRLDLATSPVSLTFGWLGAEFAVKAERLTVPSCALGDGRLRLGQAARFEQLRVAFRSPLEAGGMYASGAAAMDELELRGEASREAVELEPIEIRGLRPSISLAYERAGSAAEAAVTTGVFLAGHTSLQALLERKRGALALILRAGDADEGVRLEGGEMEVHAPGLDVQASVETGPLQPERIEFRFGEGGLSMGMRLRRTVIGVRELAGEVAGARGAFRGEATGELAGMAIDVGRDGVRVASAGSGLMLRLLGEGVIRLGETTVRLDRERATTIRVRGEIVREVDGRLILRVDGGEVQARMGRSLIVRGGRTTEGGGAIEILAG